MNSRIARRLATTRLAAAARYLAAGTGELGPADGVTPADRTRLVDAFNALAHELEVRAGVVPRKPKVIPADLADPDQHMLFDDQEMNP